MDMAQELLRISGHFPAAGDSASAEDLVEFVFNPPVSAAEFLLFDLGINSNLTEVK